jgi:hypothetical protein
MKKAIAFFGVLGVLGVFLPLVGGISLFDLRHFDWLLTYSLLAAFAIPMIAGFAEKSSVAAVLGTVCFGWVLYKFGVNTVTDFFDVSIGGKMMCAAALGGFGSSLLAFAEGRNKS